MQALMNALMAGGREDLHSLDLRGEGPCVSLFLPTHRAGRDVQQAPIRLRKLLRQAADRLEADGVDASDIEVEVKDGEVTLKGTVEERWMKRLAEDIAEVVPGVHDVHNQIRVKGGLIDKIIGEKRDERDVKRGYASTTTR